MKKVYVRWLGAFRGRFPLSKMLRYEFERTSEAACEPLKRINGRWSSNVHGCGFGLLVDPKKIIREFKFDCWSEYGEARKGQLPSRLYATYCTNYSSNHGEAWFPDGKAYTGIVMLFNLQERSTDELNVIRKAVLKYHVPVYVLTRQGELKEVKL